MEGQLASNDYAERNLGNVFSQEKACKSLFILWLMLATIVSPLFAGSASPSPSYSPGESPTAIVQTPLPQTATTENESAPAESGNPSAAAPVSSSPSSSSDATEDRIVPPQNTLPSPSVVPALPSGPPTNPNPGSVNQNPAPLVSAPPVLSQSTLPLPATGSNASASPSKVPQPATPAIPSVPVSNGNSPVANNSQSAQSSISPSPAPVVAGSQAKTPPITSQSPSASATSSNTPVAVCGNSICEAGEGQSCPKDCSGKKIANPITGLAVAGTGSTTGAVAKPVTGSGQSQGVTVLLGTVSQAEIPSNSNKDVSLSTMQKSSIGAGTSCSDATQLGNAIVVVNASESQRFYLTSPLLAA